MRLDGSSAQYGAPRRLSIVRVLIIGVSGYIGLAVAAAVAAAGHEVIPLSRREAGRGVLGDLARPETLEPALREARPDIVVHAGIPIDVGTDLAAIARLAGYKAALVYTSGIWWIGATGDGPFDERPPFGDSARARIEAAVLATAPTIRSVVIRPGIVYGHRRGIPFDMVQWASRFGIGRYVGSPGTRWPVVHVDDLADLFVAAIERAEPGAILHGVGATVLSSNVAAAADRAAGGSGRAEAWPVEAAAAELGERYAANLALDQVLDSERTRESLGWRPHRPGVVEDLAGHAATSGK
jgi:nucleoside-diphosphate-sugar epimerase